MKNILLRLCVCLGFMSNAVFAAELGSDMVVKLQADNGDSVELARIDFTKEGQGWNYQLKMNSSLFSDHFLSMRPFKCFNSPRQMLCHLPYPYDKGQTIQAGQLRDLEYDLLFIHRQSTDYGIDPWNGIYYRLKLDEAAGKITGELREVNLDGELREVNLDILAAPPEEGDTYPIKDKDLIEVELDTHAYPRVVIEKAGSEGS